jgi:hypothetical protein
MNAKFGEEASATHPADLLLLTEFVFEEGAADANK